MDYGPPGPPSMGFSRQEYCSGVPLPSPAGHNSGWAYLLGAGILGDSLSEEGRQEAQVQPQGELLRVRF